MFGHKHYVPVLRWKQAERLALKELNNNYRFHMTPLIELPPTKFGSFDQDVLRKAVKDIRDCWGNAPIYIDLHLLPSPIWGQTLALVHETAENLEVCIIPVTGLTKSDNYQRVVAGILKRKDNGVCVRIKIKEMRNTSFEKDLKRMLSILAISPKETHLIIDYEIMTENAVSLRELCNRLPRLNEWLTFSIISGVFPRDLTEIKPPGQHLIRRLDWLTYLQEIRDTAGLPRIPSFGDYTIQHPIYYEPPKRANYSASIRYTTNDAWLIMRGEAVFHPNSPGFSQYPANAQLLCARQEFCGPDFSSGDRYIYEMGQQLIRTGNARTWLTAGINHHLSFLAHQISNLTWS